jgi:hypothetical protein
MTDTDREAFIKGITDLANSDKVKKACVPNVMYHSNLDQSEVLRVLYAQKILLDGVDEKAIGGM